LRKLKLEELGRYDVDAYKKIEKIPVVVVLDSIRSALNVGSIFRTADAFSIEQVIICGFTATPPHKEITKTAIGATESVSWVYENNVVNAVQKLKSENYLLCGIEQTSTSVSMQKYEVSVKSKYALIFGNEVDGVSDDVLSMLDAAIEIPQYGTKHSLNVAVCAGIVIHYFQSYFR
jgi:23S rRNA (guanosine2251-2'-O)-methyltransferase